MQATGPRENCRLLCESHSLELVSLSLAGSFSLYFWIQNDFTYHRGFVREQRFGEQDFRRCSGEFLEHGQPGPGRSLKPYCMIVGVSLCLFGSEKV